MKERPIIMSAPMVRAILEGRKTQTRRLIKPTQQTEWLLNGKWTDDYIKDPGNELILYCPYGQVNDRLWVKETWWCPQKGLPIAYKANLEPQQADKQIWKSSLFMPRWASRILLEITEIRVERLQEITLDDCYKEGSLRVYKDEAIEWFRKLWDFLNAKRGYGWETNCWIWVISFKGQKEEKE